MKYKLLNIGFFMLFSISSISSQNPCKHQCYDDAQRNTDIAYATAFSCDLGAFTKLGFCEGASYGTATPLCATNYFIDIAVCQSALSAALYLFNSTLESCIRNCPPTEPYQGGGGGGDGNCYECWCDITYCQDYDNCVECWHPWG
ncbi:MAG: hypothetical protein IPJ13_07005 [Saprospiraceae bacterium]|nr:hypothetical protein [Saprospiraceae bacterium]